MLRTPGKKAPAIRKKAKRSKSQGEALRPPSFEPWERRYAAEGLRLVAGVDEVGRGCLAGPVVAAAVILPVETSLKGIADSKQLTPQARERLFPRILDACLGFGIGMVGARVIDDINILQASLLAMSFAVSRLRSAPEMVLVDGTHAIPGLGPIRQQALIDGDARCLSIAAASIVAKVARDRLMRYLDRDYPEYGFAGHKGYGTEAHRAALKAHGVTPLHRYTFAPVRACLP